MKQTTESLGERYQLELAKSGDKLSYETRTSGNESWSIKISKKFMNNKDDYEFIGSFTESPSSEGPILSGTIYHCTSWYLKNAPYMYFEKKEACKKNIKSKKPEDYIEG
jgi:hypothetical protein